MTSSDEKTASRSFVECSDTVNISTDIDQTCCQDKDVISSDCCDEVGGTSENLSSATTKSDGVIGAVNKPFSSAAQDQMLLNTDQDTEKASISTNYQTAIQENEQHRANSHHLSSSAKKQPKKRVVNLSNLLKCAPIKDGLNSPRSVRLCEKYNINPKELIPRRLNEFTHNDIPVNLAEMRFHSYRNRLHAHLAMLLPEYTKIAKDEVLNAESDEAPIPNTTNESRDGMARPWQVARSKEGVSTVNDNRRSSIRNQGSVLVSTNRSVSPQRGEQGNDKSRVSAHDERRASVLERHRLLQEMQHMELVRRRLEKEKQAYQRVRDLADEREIFMEMHHLQRDHPQLRQFKQLKSVAHLAAHYSRSMYLSPKRALDAEVLDEVVEHLFITT